MELINSLIKRAGGVVVSVDDIISKGRKFDPASPAIFVNQQNG